MTHRIHPYAGVKNFRDFGGHRAGARKLKTGLLYRAGHQAMASEEDLAVIAALNIATIVDLRTGQERAIHPSRRWAGFAGRIIETDHNDPTPRELEFDAAFNAYTRRADATPDGLAVWSKDWYRTCPFEERHIDLFTRYFRALAETDGPILIHCARGKDRTGLLAALTHHVAGVSREDMIEDYLHANGALATPADLAPGQGATPEMFRALVDLRPDYLDAALDAIAAHHGSVDKYLHNALGVDARMRAEIEARILE